MSDVDRKDPVPRVDEVADGLVPAWHALQKTIDETKEELPELEARYEAARKKSEKAREAAGYTYNRLNNARERIENAQDGQRGLRR